MLERENNEIKRAYDLDSAVLLVAYDRLQAQHPRIASDSNHIISLQYNSDQAKIAANLGLTFGKNGHSFLRFNFATTTENVKIAAERLEKAFSDLQ